jgi:hypothetical protein
MGAPGAGKIRFNNATIGLVTAIAVQATSHDTGNPDVSDFVATWDDSTHSPRGTITVRKVGQPAFFVTFSVNGAITDNSTWLQIPVSVVASNGTLSADDVLYLGFSRAGDDGSGVGDMLAANNLSDLTNPAQARDNLGVEIGVDVQAYNAKLAAFAGLSAAANRLPVFTGTNTIGLTTITVTGTSLVSAPTAADAFETVKQPATTSFQGVVQLADTTATLAGISTTQVVTPAGLSAALNAASGSAPVIVTNSSSPVAVASGGRYVADLSAGLIHFDFSASPTDVEVTYKQGTGISATNYVRFIPPTGKKILNQAANDTVSIKRPFHRIVFRKDADGNYN